MKQNPVPAHYYDELDDGVVRCRLCPHRCRLRNGETGLCRARRNRAGVLYAITYGAITSSAYDPMEKKPLYHFLPGSVIFSVAEWGCNLRCVFCQNSPISQYESPSVPLSHIELAKAALGKKSVGVAYTYNEPLIAIEYVMDCAAEVRKKGGKNVLVTNGYINPEPLADLLPLVDAMNIDVKAFNNEFYGRMCGGTLEPVMETVKAAVGRTHVELTTLVIPGENDAIPELEDMAAWMADTCGRKVPCHLTAYHPSYNYTQAATTAAHLTHARDIFRTRLDYVYIGNVRVEGGSDTVCANCGATVIKRVAFDTDLSGMKANGACANCGADNNIIVS